MGVSAPQLEKRSAVRIKQLLLCLAALEGVRVSYSTFKLFFDLFFTSKQMRHWLNTRSGFIVSFLELAFLVTLSIGASQCKDTDRNGLKRAIARLWRYIKKAMKGAKTALKSVHNAIQLLTPWQGQQTPLSHSVFLSVTLGLGALTIANLCWYQGMTRRRKQKMNTNQILYQDLEASSRDAEENARIYQQIQRQTQSLRLAGIASVLFSSLLSNFYQYAAVLFLFPLSYPALMALSVVCIAYCLLTIANDVYQEWENQNALQISVLELEIACGKKTVERAFKPVLTGEQYEALQHCERILQANQAALQALNTYTRRAALWVGLRNGLAAYGLLSNLLFTAVALCLFMSWSFPLLVFGIGVASGIALIAACMVHAGYHQHITASQQSIATYSNIADSFLSGCSKGAKAIDFTLKRFDSDSSTKEHHDSLLMNLLSGAGALLHGIISGAGQYVSAVKGKNKSEEIPLQPMSKSSLSARTDWCVLFRSRPETVSTTWALDKRM